MSAENPPSETGDEPIAIPIGKQVLQLSDEIQPHLQAVLRGEQNLTGSRVWVEQRHGEFFLHVGDLSVD